MEDINRYKVIEDRKHPPENGWVIIESTLLYLKDGYIGKIQGLAGDSKEEIIWSAQQFTKRTLYDDAHQYFHAQTSIKKGCLSPYDPDVVHDYDDDNNEDNDD